MDNFFFKLKQELGNIEINRKIFSFQFILAYAYAKKINIENIKIIISHETLPFLQKIY